MRECPDAGTAEPLSACTRAGSGIGRSISVLQESSRLPNVSPTEADSRGLQGTQGDSKPGHGNGLTAGIRGSRAPSPVMKMDGTGSTPAASTIYPLTTKGEILEAGSVPSVSTKECFVDQPLPEFPRARSAGGSRGTRRDAPEGP